MQLQRRGRKPRMVFDENALTFIISSWAFAWEAADFNAEKAPDHRAIYLTYEGQLTQNRGVVTQVQTGQVLEFHSSESQLNLRIQWPQGVSIYQARKDPQDSSQWLFEHRNED